MCNRHVSPIKTTVYWAGVGCDHLCIWRNWPLKPVSTILKMLRVLVIIYNTWFFHKDPWRSSFLVLESEICESSENWCVFITQSVDQVSNEYHSSQELLGSSQPNWWLTLREGIHFMNWTHSWIQFLSSPGSPFALLFFPAYFQFLLSTLWLFVSTFNPL